MSVNSNRLPNIIDIIIIGVALFLLSFETRIIMGIAISKATTLPLNQHKSLNKLTPNIIIGKISIT